MHRMGHGSMRAALIHQHATSERTGRSRLPWTPGSSVKRGRSGPYVARRRLNLGAGRMPEALEATLTRTDAVER
jgi:hypothetical protein